MVALLERLVAEKKAPWTQLLVSRRGRTVFEHCVGAPADNLHRWYSCTKAITSVALMMLFEEGSFMLADPVYKFLGDAWRKENMRVYTHWQGVDGTVPCETDITMKMLLTHTSGLSYAYDEEGDTNKVDLLYRIKGLRIWDKNQLPRLVQSDSAPLAQGRTLAEWVAEVAKMPLLFQPGTAWNYGFGHDLCGLLVEVISGMRFSEFLQTRIFGPLGMTETGFTVPEGAEDRFTPLYMWTPEGMVRTDQHPDAELAEWYERSTSKFLGQMGRPVNLESGGGGLVGPARDFMRFAQMLANGGELDGVRILSHKTLEFMSANHLPGQADLTDVLHKDAYYQVKEGGWGFGLGWAVAQDPGRAESPFSRGTLNWGGAAGTYWWVDPEEDLAVVFATQLMNRDDLVFSRRVSRNIVYGALEPLKKRR
jgi:CubicO group peptidase (beta-lactamase class C family)